MPSRFGAVACEGSDRLGDGLAATARVITAAALIMVTVFGSFVFGDNSVVKLFGLGLAAAILIDATIVRLVLVPATMELLGDRNWWLPKWLDRILPRVHVESAHSLEEELAELKAEESARGFTLPESPSADEPHEEDEEARVLLRVVRLPHPRLQPRDRVRIEGVERVLSCHDRSPPLLICANYYASRRMAWRVGSL